MRRVFLSFLGTNDYLPCNYSCMGKEVIENVRFVQEATITWNCSDWSDKDQIIIFVTKDSYERNWVDNGHNVKDRSTLQGLESRLTALSLKVPFDKDQIPVGKNEDEIWQIFTTIFNKIQDGDELYLDITHAFRSLPLLAMVMMNYAKVTRKITVKAIHYGAMEALGTAYKVKDWPVTERNVPVFDLLPFDSLLDWSLAIDRFTASGDATAVQELTQKEISPILRQSKGKDQEATALRMLAGSLNDFTTNLGACRGKDIAANAGRLKSAVQKVREQELVKPLTPLVDKLSESTSDFGVDEIRDGAASAKWCLSHGLIQQGYTILQETIISNVLMEIGVQDIYDRESRELVGKGCKIVFEQLSYEAWDPRAQEGKDLVILICNRLKETPALVDCLRNLTNDRNDLNHAGMRPDPMAAGKFTTKLKKYLDIFQATL